MQMKFLAMAIKSISILRCHDLPQNGVMLALDSSESSFNHTTAERFDDATELEIALPFNPKN